ncbi:MAG: nucleotide sugar dehydrogenase [Balneolaceae bacterium]|nr:nucleotide sugar dehydrogenase [Balneolaceae bacterium]
MSREHIRQLVTLVGPRESIIDTIQKMAKKEALHTEIAVIADSEFRVLGVFNDGDVLRLISTGVDLDQPISNVMVKDPVVVKEGLSHEEIITEVREQLRKRGVSGKKHVRSVLIVDESKILVNVINYIDLLSAYKKFEEEVAIYGQGFVGLTLAASLASIGHTVVGVDKDESLISKLQRGEVHVYEPRLSDMVKASLDKGTLTFSASAESNRPEIHIISVGTPVNDSGEADLDALTSVCETIGGIMKRGDLVMLRSTVPVGTTRNVVKPLLEKVSDYKAGQDFYLAFTPERTAEGKAMAELRELPQIVGGLTPICTQKAASFWSSLTDTVVQVKGVEASELVKLINNSFRDLSFSFSNAISALSDKYNIDSFKLINAANEGYPRNKIPTPSPGVGGYCLTKDPYLFAAVNPELGHARLAKEGRKINQQAADYPVEILKRYSKQRNLKLSDLTVFIVGLAFKGWPATNDMRGSSALHVARKLKNEKVSVKGWDAVVKPDEIRFYNIEPVDFYDGCNEADAILIMNNHPDNVPSGFLSKLKNKKMLIFDGWSMLSSNEIERIPGLTYSTMGYLSNN